MNLNYPLQSKESEEKMSKAKFVFFGFVFMLAFMLFTCNFTKVNAKGVTDDIKIDGVNNRVNVVINSSTFVKNGVNGTFASVELGSGNDIITFLQANGNDREVQINFNINNFPAGVTSFMIVESGYSDSSNNPDSDRYSYGITYTLANEDIIANGNFVKVDDTYYDIIQARRFSDESCAVQNDNGSYYKVSTTLCYKMERTNVYKAEETWVPGEKTTGTVTFSEQDVEIDGVTSARKVAHVTYKVREGRYGLNFFRIVFYKAEISTSTPADSMDVFFALARPIDAIDFISTGACSGNEAICTDYVNGTLSRESKKLNLYIPNTVAFDFKALSKEEAIANYKDVTKSTIYAINYFIEEGNEIKFVDADALSGNDVRNYLYTNFKMMNTGAKDTQDIVDALNDAGNTFHNALNDFVVNEIDYLQMEVDATGSYYFYLTDIFGNKTNSVIPDNIEDNESKIVRKDVDDVKNRSIETIVKKSNADENGYGAEETFTNESVQVTLNMEVKTNFEYGQCINGKCADKTVLGSSNIKIIRYWRVNVQYKGENDKDAFDEGDTTSGDTDLSNYASESYGDQSYYLVCNEDYDSNCVNRAIQNFANDDNGINIRSQGLVSFGTVGFDGDSFKMMIGLAGRYRFYIEDVYGNNTWGSNGDLNIAEYRNPRVEVYAIDKEAPEITFDHDGVNGDMTSFDVETFEYYNGIGSDAIKYVVISEENRYSLSNGAYVQNDEGDYLKYGNSYYKIENIRRYSQSGETYVRNNEGTYLQIFEYGTPKANKDSAVSGGITSVIYYAADGSTPGTKDKSFTDELAIVLSRVTISEYIYSHNGGKKLYADFNKYENDRDNYALSGESNSRVSTIAYNVKNNSNGLRLNNGIYSFANGEITYYHNDGVKKVCAQIGAVDGMDYTVKNQLDCVNYYLDHGVDFIIEFSAEDSVGNRRSERVYVNVVDTTAPGFSDGANIRSTNVIADDASCRMEIGQQIGSGQRQDKTKLLNCYNIISGNVYNFEDNVYDESENYGLGRKNRINSDTYVKLYILADNGVWVDLQNNVFTPNKTGYYDIKIEIHDNTIGQDGTNKLTLLISYYVDKRIVLVAPVAGSEKFYGEEDVTFDYCMFIDESNNYELRFSSNPYDLAKVQSVYSKVYCSNGTAADKNTGLDKIFNDNNSGFVGNLSRVESAWYNANLSTPIWFDSDEGIGVENNYVGDYEIILGTLNINDLETGAADSDYILKIHPAFRVNTKYNGTENGNIIIKADSDNPLEDVSGLDNNPLEDDNSYTQSNVTFTIKQIIINVEANGGNKLYGDVDNNYTSYNSDNAENKYLNGYTVTGFITGNQYSDDATVVRGVLRREVGEDVGLYYICNYRGGNIDDNTVEEKNNMYVDCEDSYSPGEGFDFTDSDTHGYGLEIDEVEYKALLKINRQYIDSRALYIATNKRVAGRTMNTTTDSRNNRFANYVINYTGAYYQINPIDLIIQAAPGQRREYNYTNTYDPNPWEIILYGLNESYLKVVNEFSGYTTSGHNYSETIQTLNECAGLSDEEKENKPSCYAAMLPANASEVRNNWYYQHNGTQLKGLKTNDSYNLLRSTVKGSNAGSAELVNKKQTLNVTSGGWYLYETLGTDYNVFENNQEQTGVSLIAVMTNENNHCSYDASGHILSIGGTSACKNYNLIYEPYYTDESGFTYINSKEGSKAEDYVYKSNNISCLVLDEGSPCSNTQLEPNKIYKIMYEIYRREIIMEFNSAIEEIILKDNQPFLIQYGERYNFYNDKLFSMNNYYGADKVPNLHAEDYLFICYQNGNFTDSGFSSINSNSTGCTGNPRFGLTEGDDWENIGLTFKLHDTVVSNHSEGSTAIPSGVYYVYANISTDQEKNYNFKYLGGSLTIKSKPVDIIITSYEKEYGEVYYNKYGTEGSLTDFIALCFEDKWIVSGVLDEGSPLISVDCSDLDASNTNKNKYGFYVSGLDEMDLIADNFAGGPRRVRNGSSTEENNVDVNGLQDHVGIYTIGMGNIRTKNNNPYIASNSCNEDEFKENPANCIVVKNNSINNYVVDSDAELRTYVVKLYGSEDAVTLSIPLREPQVVKGALYITPATMKITVTGNQSKMYGCSYNTANTSGVYSYNAIDGYFANCIEGTGSYYDLGYEYTVEGDKDYQIANNGYDVVYSSDNAYKVSGIKGSTPFRPSNKDYGARAHGLNEFGTLYRVKDTETIRNNGIKFNSFMSDLISVQAGTLYQEQIVGSYILTLGNVDAFKVPSVTGVSNACDENNNPDRNGMYICKNYNIDYYGTGAYNESYDDPSINNGNTSLKYLKGENFPSEIIFRIDQRRAYIYTDYDSKIYGEDDPDIVEEKCTQDDIDLGFCRTKDETINYQFGITKYYVRKNSLAKYPWNETVVANSDDVHIDIVSGKLTREGMNGGAPAKNDVQGLYEYVFSNISTKSGVGENYTLVFGDDDGHAVNILGEDTTYIKDGDGNILEEYPVEFEIILRRIKIKFISFNKVYGEKDDVKDYDILICAPSQEFIYEDGGWKCGVKDPTDRHGLSPAHATLKDSNGMAVEEFKSEFILRYKRALGENVSCGTDHKVEVTLNGNFFGDNVSNDGKTYTINLNCENVKVRPDDESNKDAYATLAYIEQGDETAPGYNYEVSYTIGYVAIDQRPIIITPDEGQGFVYGDYHNTLIPAITFTTAGDNTLSEYGLVNGGTDDGEDVSICLENIDYYNNDQGTCFNINDRMNEYEEGSNKTIKYTNPVVADKYGVSDNAKNYVFADVYENEGSTRIALNRMLSGKTNERYNRNAGVYTITLGELETTAFANYTIKLTNDANKLKYTITSAEVRVTPRSDQYKIYGESDVEIKFDVVTSYKVTSTHYAEYNTNIIKICSGVSECITQFATYNYDEENRKFNVSASGTGTYIKVNENDTVHLVGFAYGENNGSNIGFDYGANKGSNKTGNATSAIQNIASSEGVAYHYDKYCRVLSADYSCGANSVLTYTSTTKILLGYLYVSDYSQSAGIYPIVSGLVIADNEFDKKNYDLISVSEENFKVIPRPIGIEVKDVTKTYGQATDKISCDVGLGIEDCELIGGILSSNAEGYLKYNFDVVSDLSSSIGISNILDGNLSLYSNGANSIVNGLVGKWDNTNYIYSASGNQEVKNSTDLGVYVSRDEKSLGNDGNAKACLTNGDKFGFCEDVGTYNLRLYGYNNEIDNLTVNSYSTEYRPTNYPEWELVSGLTSYYYGTYFGYNPNYFVVVVKDGNAIKNIKETEEQVTTSREIDGLLIETASLTINKKNIVIAVNTNYFDGVETYYIEQNSKAPKLPSIDNNTNLNVDVFNTNRETALGTSTYGTVVWGLHNNQVRRSDKLDGTLSYCNQVIAKSTYDSLWQNGWSSTVNHNVCKSSDLFVENPLEVKTNLTGYIPIVRDTAKLYIVSEIYESSNYVSIFYPGALRIEIDDTKPVVQVNRGDVYIEANAKGTYSYDCVVNGEIITTTYSNCNGLQIVGSYDKDDEELILRWLKEFGETSINGSQIIVGQLPTIESCDTYGYECTASAYFQLVYGKGSDTFNANGGIVSGTVAGHVSPFSKQTEAVDNTSPGYGTNESHAELINALVNWFGVTAYDLGEIRDGRPLTKVFDKYWFIMIEKLGVDSEGNDVDFAINKVGSYKVHFYVMDNAGNVSQGNMNTEAYYEIKESDRYRLANGNYIQDNTGNYLKVSKYVEIKAEDMYRRNEDGTYTAAVDGNGEYLKYGNNYYLINSYKKYSYDNVSGNYIANESGNYIEVLTSYYLIENSKRYDKNGLIYEAATDGDYLKVSDGYTNVGTLHIIDTTKPEVGTLNLYNGRVSCSEDDDCGVEDNWKVSETIYLPYNILDIDALKEYIIGFNENIKYSYKGIDATTNKPIYEEDPVYGKLYKIPQGTNAKAIKHYSWSNVDVFFTITGGRDNSYTEYSSKTRVDSSQWSHYYSRDGGITWFSYSKTKTVGELALASEGSREILIKAVDKGVKIIGKEQKTSSYYTTFYGLSSEHNSSSTMTYYDFSDSSSINYYLKDITLESIMEEDFESESYYATIRGEDLGWNVSDSAPEDVDDKGNSGMSNKISLLIYGESSTVSGYKYYRDKQTAYYDKTKPIVSLFGEKLYLFEYGCATLCVNGYTENYAGAIDLQGTLVNENKNTTQYNINNTVLLNLIVKQENYQGDYKTIDETLMTNLEKSGLGNNKFAMSGVKEENYVDIRNIYEDDRSYVIHAYVEGRETIYNLSSSTLLDNNNIADKIPSGLTGYSGGDRTYTIVYSVMDKAGNESVYVSRGVVFANLIPNIEIDQNEPEEPNGEEIQELSALGKIDEQTYYMSVEQGQDVSQIVNSLSVEAGMRSSYLTQTIYYNGELVVDNKKYNPNIYDGFNTNAPGVYEITYNLQFNYRSENGESELISANPVKLVINVEATAPIANSSQQLNYSSIILLISLLTGMLFIAVLVVLSKKKN